MCKQTANTFLGPNSSITSFYPIELAVEAYKGF